jgi:hypothetical protein
MSILSQFNQSQNTDFPNVRPSLDLRFALAKKLDPRITFTRGSPGTYFGSDGIMRTADVNEPRFDHDPITGQSLGLLIEESRQNLLTYSEEPTGWNTSSASVSQNVITSPNGTQTADKMSVGSSTFLQITQSPSATVSNTHTFSVFLKAGELKYVQLRVRNFGSINNYFRVICNLVTGELTSGISNGTGTYTSASATKFPNDWWRFTVTGIADTSGTQLTATLIGQINASSAASVSNSSPTDGFYWWGAQLEQGSFPTSYIPTDSTPGGKLRSADIAQMTGTNFSSWYNSTEGTLCVDLRNYNSSSTVNFGISIGSASNNYFAFPYINSFGQLINDVYWRETGSSARILDLPTGGSGGKYAISYKNRQSFFGYLNGSSGIIDNPPYPTQSGYNQLYIGRSHFSPTNQNFYLRRLTYYPIQLTNQQLINLTS